MSKDQPQGFYCSFCCKSSKEVAHMLKGEVALICDECINLCAEFVAAERAKAAGEDRIREIVREEMSSLRAGLDAIAANTARTADVLSGATLVSGALQDGA